MKEACLAVVALVAVATCAVEVEVSAKFADDKAVAFAANDLRDYLKDVPGKIVLAEEPSLKRQGWRFATSADGTVTIAGGTGLGTVYGAYTFLERHCGVRWYAPDTERPATIKALPRLNEAGHPAMIQREMSTRDPGPNSSHGYWRLRNKETRAVPFDTQTHTGKPAGCHSMVKYVECVTNAALFGVTESGRKCGNLCMSNPEVAHLVAQQMIRYIKLDRKQRKGLPDYTFPQLYELSQPDGGGGNECHCKDCHAAYVSAGNRYSGPNIRFANAVAAEVAKVYPDVHVRTFAYSYTELPPADVKAVDNVDVRYCRSFLYQPITADTYNGKTLKEWHKHASGFYVWSYWRTYSGPLFPVVKPRADIGAEMKFCCDNGVCGYYAEAESPLERSFVRLQQWLFLKMADDPNQDVMALADEFMRAYYGAAAEPMTAYLSYLEGRLVSLRGRIPQELIQNVNSGYLAMYSVCDYMDMDFFAKANAWLDEAEARVKDDPKLLRHVRKERTVVDRAFFDNIYALNAAGYVPDAKAIAARYLRNMEELIENWGINGKTRKELLKTVRDDASLFARLPLELPKELRGRNVTVYHANRLKNKVRSAIADQDSPAGFAVDDGLGRASKKPYSLKLHAGNPAYRFDLDAAVKDIPQDETYHVFREGECATPLDMRLYFGAGNSKLWLPCYGMPAEKREFWVSLKFMGPKWVKGSKSANRVLIDRVFVAEPSATEASK